MRTASRSVGRHITRRPKILVHNHCYHGTVDETFAGARCCGRRDRPAGEHGPAGAGRDHDPGRGDRRPRGLARELEHEDVAVCVFEPALTNIGIVLPEPGYWEAVRAICDRTGTLLLIDETHTLSAGPGGATRAWGLAPDLLTIGKTLGAGIPSAAYGMTEDVQRRIVEAVDPDVIDVGGTGGTLAGNALSLAAMHATLGRCSRTPRSIA